MVVLVAVLVVASVVAWAEGRRRAPEERTALTACAARAEAVTSRAESQVAATTSYAAPVYVSADPGLRESMRGLVSRSAARAVEPVEEALAACRSVDVWPFNRSHTETRDAYVTYLVAERDRLQEIAVDGSAFEHGYAGVRRLAGAAEALLNP